MYTSDIYPVGSRVQTWQCLTPNKCQGSKTGSIGLTRWLMASSLTTVPGKLLAMVSVTHHSDALAPKQRHLLQPANLIQPQPRQDGGKVGRNMATLVHSDGTTCPVHQHQIIGKGIRQTIRCTLVGKRQQQGWQWSCGLLAIETLLEAGVIALLRPIGQSRSYRVEVNVRHAGQQG